MWSPSITFFTFSLFFFFNDTATTEIYTLSLHDALPNFEAPWRHPHEVCCAGYRPLILPTSGAFEVDRKSTRLNSSHMSISYAVFCLKKKSKLKSNVIIKKKKKT